MKETRKAEKAIEKENNTYTTRKGILERRVKDLGGTIAPPAPAGPLPEGCPSAPGARRRPRAGACQVIATTLGPGPITRGIRRRMRPAR